ncbi:hypothetical protein Leryth_014667 [Lithospermum erythrorhizon]|nr:hypothetical protein Leryth_014667 [Lithospermum erythrorhizon]
MSKVLNMLCCYVEDPTSEAFKLHLPRINVITRVAEDGMKMQAVPFDLQAEFLSHLLQLTLVLQGYNVASFEKSHEFIKKSQVLQDCPGNLDIWYRHISKGAWAFFDCRSSGGPFPIVQQRGSESKRLYGILSLSTLPSELVGTHWMQKRVYDAVNVILSLQNDEVVLRLMN